MILDSLPLERLYDSSSSTGRAVLSFLKYIERKLQVTIVKNIRGATYSHIPTYLQERSLKLLNTGVILSFGKTELYPDEPQVHVWHAVCNTESKHPTGGSSWISDERALTSTLSEALERYLWVTQTDYFQHPQHASANELRVKGIQFIPVSAFAGYSAEQKAAHLLRNCNDDTQLLWIVGKSQTTGGNVLIPAQTVSPQLSRATNTGREPQIRQATTNGLATWTSPQGAHLFGALELIERDAYMIFWLNQLVLPRVVLAPLLNKSDSLKRCVETCERYRFKVHALQMVSDAPTHCIAVVLEDQSGTAPRFSFGLKAHYSLTYAIEKAVTEALRSHHSQRWWEKQGNTWDPATPVDTIGHRERLRYWALPENARKLEKLLKGPELIPENKVWDTDTEEVHLNRIKTWCKDASYDFISVSLGYSKANPTDLSVEMVVIPQLQPAYLTEDHRTFGGTRLTTIPRQCGYSPLPQPYTESPHPFS